jgi:DNA-directed RNA polymerase specialized sigma24 family protein
MENIKLIRKIAKSFSHSTGFDWKELMQEAVFGYYNGLKSFDPERGKITTHVWHCVSNHLRNYLRTENIYDEVLEPIEAAADLENPGNDFFESLSTEALQVAQVFIESPLEFNCLPPEQAQKKAVEKLLEKGVDLSRIYAGLKDLRLACQ